MLLDGSDDAFATILLAHGAGVPMDAATMNSKAASLVDAGFRVARFEFRYMAARRQVTRKPPPRAELLMDEYRAAIDELDATGDGWTRCIDGGGRASR